MNVLYRIAHSLSARLIGIFLITSIVYGFASRYTVELVLDRDYLREIIGSHVALHTTYLLQDIGVPPRVERAQQIADENPLDIRIQGPDMDWSSAPGFPDNALIEFEPSEFLQYIKSDALQTPEGVNLLGQMGFARYNDHSFIRMELGDYVVTLSSPKIATEPGPNITTPLIGLISILVLTGCFFAVSWLIRPIRWIKYGADRFRHGDLDYRIPMTRHDDLGNLTVEINSLAGDVQSMLEAKQQMLLAISHELRSPLTRTKVALEFLDDENVKQNILDDVREMERLIADLLESERLNTRHSALQRSSTDLKALISDLVAQEFGDSATRINIHLPGVSLVRDVDATRVRLLLKNLIDNALRYSESDKQVVVELSTDNGVVSITIVDEGSGMSPDDVERATEPFYRADPARSRDTGGFGLGLYLCRRIAEAHGGSLCIDSEVGRGTRVTLSLPDAPSN